MVCKGDMEIKGYRNIVELAKGLYSRLFSAERESDGKLLLIKATKSSPANEEELAVLRHEAAMHKRLDGAKYLPKLYSIEAKEGLFAFAMEWIPSPSLSELLREKGALAPSEFLPLALAAVDALEELHRADIVHRDISEHNLLYDSVKRECKIVDLSLSIAIPCHRMVPRNPDLLQGTLAYISPEQTGRMNRGTDYRTDYYSLGVLFYKAATGELPFLSSDPFELVYSHIAIRPEAPKKLEPSLPEVLSHIILKLLAKDPDERYQSIAGLRGDLLECKRRLEGEAIPFFAIGASDTFERFRIPEKIYGREQEVEQLLQKYEEVAKGGSGVIAIGGYSGVGKTSLVHELYKPVGDREGLIISGKFDQFKRDIPYYAFNQAFTEYIREMLKLSDKKLEEFRVKLQKALGNIGRLMTDALPDLKLIVGEQPEVANLGVEETKNRFSYLFRRFVESLPTSKRPLILFLDDLQWADRSSLRMIVELSSVAIPHLLIIGGYRDNEVDSAHPLTLAMEQLEKESLSFDKLVLKPLSPDVADRLIADTLLRKGEEVRELSSIAYKKSGGNPFFLIQLLQKLHESDLIHYEWESAKWVWESGKIASQEISDNVVELMIEKIETLSEGEKNLLMAAACIGNKFSLSLLNKIVGEEEELRPLLEQLIQKEMLYTPEINYYSAENFHFAHDRIQQAAHELLGSERQKRLHLEIAEELMAATPGDKKREVLFTIVDHYNRGVDEASSIGEAKRREIAKLNSESAKIAKSSGAYETALAYCQRAMAWLGESDFSGRDYPFLIDLYSDAMESAYLSQREELVASYGSLIKENSSEPFDALRAVQVEAQLAAHKGEHGRALQLQSDMAERLGFPIPKKLGKGRLLFEFLLTRLALLRSRKSIEELVDLPKSGDARREAADELLTELMYTAVFLTNFDLYGFLILRAARHALQLGSNNSVTGFFYVAFGSINIALGDIAGGIRWGEAGRRLSDQFVGAKGSGRSSAGIILTQSHWKEQLQGVLPRFAAVYEECLEGGDLTFAPPALGFEGIVRLQSTITPLSELLQIVKKNRAIFQQNKNSEQVEWMDCILSSLGELMLSSPAASGGGGGDFPKVEEGKWRYHTSRLGFYCYSSIAGYVVREYKKCIDATDKFFDVEEAAPAMLFVPLYYFYRALAMAALYAAASFREKLSMRFKICYALYRMRRFAKHSPDNYTNKYFFMEAEWARCRGEFGEAERCYSLSIEAASAANFLGEEAMANEQLARLYIERGWMKKASLYLLEAYSRYAKWGAAAKLKLLEEEFPEWFGKEREEKEEDKKEGAAGEEEEGETAKTLTRALGSKEFDIASIQRSAETIASTILLDKLIRRLIAIVIEHAGAEKCILIMSRGDRYSIEAEGSCRMGETQLLPSLEITEERLPVSIVQHVIRYKREVLLKEAYRDRQFSGDNYIQRERVRSLLCSPLISNNKITALLYLENNLVGDAFTEERLRMLRLLSSQVAMALDNAKLYEGTLKLNEAYERFVPKDFIELLGKKSIIEVALGDHREREMSVLFTDIRSFTTLSEAMSPKENFAFINEFLSYMEPAIRENGGFIDKYIGDAIMALFPESADDALSCGIAMLKELERYNEVRRGRGEGKLQIGIGINSGKLILGTVGNELRMDGTVISDAVNVASRIEHLTKEYNVPILITEMCYQGLKAPSRYDLERIGETEIRGKREKMAIYTVRSLGIAGSSLSAQLPPQR